MTNATFYTTARYLDDDDKFDTYDEALTDAKRKAVDSGDDTAFVLQALARVETPVPEAEVTTLS